MASRESRKRTQKKSGSKFSSPHGREDIDEPQDPNKPNTAKKGPRPLTRDDPDVAFGFAGDGDGVTPQPFLAQPPAPPPAEARPAPPSTWTPPPNWPAVGTPVQAKDDPDVHGVVSLLGRGQQPHDVLTASSSILPFRRVQLAPTVLTEEEAAVCSRSLTPREYLQAQLDGSIDFGYAGRSFANRFKAADGTQRRQFEALADGVVRCALCDGEDGLVWRWETSGAIESCASSVRRVLLRNVRRHSGAVVSKRDTRATTVHLERLLAATGVEAPASASSSDDENDAPAPSPFARTAPATAAEKATYEEAAKSMGGFGFFPAKSMPPPNTQSKFGRERPDDNVNDSDDGSFQSGTDVMSEVDSDEAVSELLGDWRAFNGELKTKRDELVVEVERATDALAKAREDLPDYDGHRQLSGRTGAAPSEDEQIFNAFRTSALAPEQRELDNAIAEREAFPAVVKQERTNWARQNDLGLSSEVAAGLREFHAPMLRAIEAQRDAARRLVKHRDVETRQVLGGGDWVGPCTFRWRGDPPDATYFDDEESETVRSLPLGVWACGCGRCGQWWLRPMTPVISSFDGKLQVEAACRTCLAQEGEAGTQGRNKSGRLRLYVDRRDFGFKVKETLARSEMKMPALVRFA